jgi:hypothetical protein
MILEDSRRDEAEIASYEELDSEWRNLYQN